MDYAARVAMEMGADVVKLNLPKKSEKDADMPEKYRKLERDLADGARRVTASAGNTLVLFSGGSRVGHEDLLEKARIAMDAERNGNSKRPPAREAGAPSSFDCNVERRGDSTCQTRDMAL